ncbi:LysR family transcriptional regulator [Aquamicrobium sp.]|uniref:helix-turn-helix domain-containing protein n=1 Tax=Aquamicrobium sp. TaxID=1872579 RepID=UPI00349E8274
MSGSNSPLWERPVRWPAEGLPFALRALRYVLAAAEQMSFSGAAGALGMKVSSVSRHVRCQDEVTNCRTCNHPRQLESRQRRRISRYSPPLYFCGHFFDARR